MKFSGDAAILAFFHIAYCLTLPGESLRLNRFDAISAIFGAPEKRKVFRRAVSLRQKDHDAYSARGTNIPRCAPW